MVLKAALLISFLTLACQAKAKVIPSDSTLSIMSLDNGGSKTSKDISPRWGYMIMAVPGKVLALDRWARNEVVTNDTWALAGELRYTPQPGDDDSFAEDYGYPTFSVGFRYSFNHGTKLTRVEKDYYSVLGNVATVYGKFSRPILRTHGFELAYYLGTGVGYSHRKYDTGGEVNNEFIGSRWNIYFTAGLSATYRIGPEWAVMTGVDFSHHSNGALKRPNKGSNYLGPVIGLVYSPQKERAHEKAYHLGTESPDDPRQGLYMELSAGLGAKTLLEDWLYTQEHPDIPKYRTTKFASYGAFSLQTAVMFRYARRWASGLGLDVFYGDYASKIRRLDDITGHSSERHSPWSVGVAMKHEVFYGRLSVRMGVGTYLYRHMGYIAKKREGPKWLYERVGLFYSFPTLGHASIGFNVNAHLTKADFTELVVSYPIKL